ncbi:MAG: hypothetical protein UW73_C0029G0004 [Microgenomates group bacterium GW2011_GWB1_44_8]|nr:MAG: hypothetical protein UW73_C0029G0004 [Microgenomates group bacterium GW2011_GWB1_44_8]
MVGYILMAREFPPVLLVENESVSTASSPSRRVDGTLVRQYRAAKVIAAAGDPGINPVRVLLNGKWYGPTDSYFDDGGLPQWRGAGKFTSRSDRRWVEFKDDSGEIVRVFFLIGEIRLKRQWVDPDTGEVIMYPFHQRLPQKYRLKAKLVNP